MGRRIGDSGEIESRNFNFSLTRHCAKPVSLLRNSKINKIIINLK